MKKETKHMKIDFKLAFLVGLGWTLGTFLGSFIQYLLTQFAINPLLRYVTSLLGL